MTEKCGLCRELIHDDDIDINIHGKFICPDCVAFIRDVSEEDEKDEEDDS